MVTVHWPLVSVMQLRVSVLGGWAFFFLMIRRPPRATLSLYTTLFRSAKGCGPEPVSSVSVMVKTWSVLTLLGGVHGWTPGTRAPQILASLCFTVTDPESKVVLV